MKIALLTTVDNPWNPWTHPDEWTAYDQMMGWNTPGLLARIANTTEGVSDEINDEEIDRAMDEIVAMHNGMIYKKVYPPDAL